MTPPSAATERGHSMPDQPVRLQGLRGGVLVWECEACGARAIRYDGNEYGGAVEADCVGAAA